MSVSIRRLVPRAVLTAAVLLAPAAQAFFPFGGFNENEKKVIVKWPRAAMDRNHDGDVSGLDEGVPYWIEDGVLGYSAEEVQIVKDAFAVWQNVPSSYMAFAFEGTIREPILLGDATDKINTISLANAEEDNETGPLGAGILGITISLVAVDDAYDEEGSVTGGTILESDIIIDKAAVTEFPLGSPPIADLKAVLVHEIGHFLGLDHTPLNNLIEDDATFELVDPAVVALRDAEGQLQLVGATPTMFPIYFKTEAPDGQLYPGSVDLAPDDIAGVSFMYPRKDQSLFFDLNAKIRSRGSYALSSLPLAGAHIVAWADVDDYAGTARVPLFSTMSSLYEGHGAFYSNERGDFELKGLYRQLESFTSASPFAVTYTFTSSPIDESGYDRQAPFGYSPEDFDSTHLDDVSREYDFDLSFYSEVFYFNETKNKQDNPIGMERFETGTPLYFDSDRQKIVSAISGRTIDNMLIAASPMFGDSSCPYNAAAAGLTTDKGRQFLYRLRDRVLLPSALGAALVDAYYRLGPDVCRFLWEHRPAMAFARGMVWSLEWSLTRETHVLPASLALGLALAGVLMMAGARRRLRPVMTALVLAVGLLWASTGHAMVMMWDTEDMLANSTEVVAGTVTGVQPRLTGGGAVVSDIQIAITGTAKGGVNKGANVYLKQIGGRVGAIAMVASDLPRFVEGEEVVLYLNYHQSTGTYSVTAGQRGKLEVKKDAKTGTPMVHGVEAAVVKAALGKAAPKDGPAAAVPLEQYFDYLRTVVRAQAAQTAP